tara:strand:+ start:7718 stop:9181 length:1464 start_codon:yes stop_codon:yes gene_type:complete
MAGAVMLNAQPCGAQHSWQCDALSQRMPDGQAYLDIQTSWMSERVDPSDSLTVTVIVTSQDEVLGFAKNNVLTRPAVADSSRLQHVHVDRIAVPDGFGSVEWSVMRDGDLLHVSNLTYHISPGGFPEIMDPMIVSTHAKATEYSDPNMVHSGLDLIPWVGRRIALEQSAAMFYLELHRIQEVVGQDSLFLLAFGWANVFGEWDAATTKYKRLKAGSVVPVLESLPCTPSSPDPIKPTLKLEVRTREGYVVVSRDVVFPGRAAAAGRDVKGDASGESLALYSAPLLPSVLQLTDPDRLVRHLFDHLAMATTNEQNTIQNVLVPQRDVQQMQQYISGFWLERSNSVAEAQALHQQYLGRIAFVDGAYGDCKQGQGSQTEMGNIFLRFGQPNTVVKRHNETDYYPYEIWHYHKAGRFNNKRFLFFAPHVVSECFEMLHSDMLGERQNEDWLSQLRSRENRLRVTESMQNRLNPRDAFSRSEPEDLFYNPR